MLLFKPSKSVVKIAYAAGNQSPMDCFIAQTVRVFFDPEISRGEKLALLSSKLLAHLLVIVAAPAIELNGYLKLQRSSMATCPTPNMTTMPWVGVGSWFEKTFPQKMFDFQDLYFFLCIFMLVSEMDGNDVTTTNQTRGEVAPLSTPKLGAINYPRSSLTHSIWTLDRFLSS